MGLLNYKLLPIGLDSSSSDNGLSEDFAEFLGIMAGDGNIYIKPKGTTNSSYRVIITGHKTEDRTYLEHHVRPLIQRLFGIEPSLWEYKDKAGVRLTFHSTAVVERLVSLGLPVGNKNKIAIPPVVKNGNGATRAAFIRGLADTDFSVIFKKGPQRKTYSYPIITTTFASEALVYELSSLLKGFGIRANVYPRKRIMYGTPIMQYDIHAYGKKALTKWLELIGFRNEKHLTKIALWKATGTCEPHTTLRRRKQVLNKLANELQFASRELPQPKGGKGGVDGRAQWSSIGPCRSPFSCSEKALAEKLQLGPDSGSNPDRGAIMITLSSQNLGDCGLYTGEENRDVVLAAKKASLGPVAQPGRAPAF